MTHKKTSKPLPLIKIEWLNKKKIKKNHCHYLLFLPPLQSQHSGLGLFASEQEEACRSNNENVTPCPLCFCPSETPETCFLH